MLLQIHRLGAVAIIVGSILLSLYAIGYWCLLPVSVGPYDYLAVVQNQHWRWLAITAFVGVMAMLFGFASVYSRITALTGWIGLLGFFAVEFAYLLQACKVTWEIFIYPVLAEHADVAYLLKDGVLRKSASVIQFKIMASSSIFLGIILFCYALWKSKQFSTSAVAFIFVGAFIYGFGPLVHALVAILGILIFTAGCFLLGRQLLKQLAV